MLLTLSFYLVGGFGLFMYGLKVFSDGLQESTENALKDILHKVTQNKILGISLGFLITAIVQSSSAVTVMTVSFVNANLLTLSQAINIILGANIGTTVTGWIISLNIDVLALPSLGIGSIIVIFGSENRKLRFFGEILMGFGMIFYGLILMKTAFEGVRGSEDFEKVFLMANADTMYGRFLCVVIGMVVTAIIQSSSAALGVTISLASVGLIDYPTGVALILGQNIGTTITAVLATLGASTNAKRAALVHCLFNIFGVVYMFFLFPYYIKLVDVIVGFMNIGDPNLVVNNKYVNISFYIAAAHTMFNIINVIVFYFLTEKLEKVVCIIIKDKEDEKHVSVLSDKLLNMPVSAEIEVRKEVTYMGDIAKKMLARIEQLFDNPSEKLLTKIRDHEKMLDNTDQEIHAFLLKLLGKNTLNSANIASLINISTYYENLGDNLKDLGKAIIKGNEKKTLFSETQKEDIIKMLHNNKDFIDYLSGLILQYYSLNREKTYDEAMEKYHQIKGFYYEARERHYDNVDKSLIPALNAHLYGDVLVYFNRSIANLVNIVEAITGKDK
ncbi:Na/Pi cotransporter family protein [Brachyspira hyodysenteriae]|uniref:Na/Pi cotransporter family protein n=1 Tax=Brachyspira hyodysenteriae TaxID=159 RepID=UPI0022CD918B|nr:Na/Pi cotransporter family protein [Brachyspira hyodysenteriae]MCZ9840459.1 Na/Pi cotransporter family protein [Brachyspira hyodysenteriae]MCZ9848847.1 Na/Pi cotransporter family protein [Brachyspira hyodysenteriae]MCZ9852327.1 Na/Pi cotransporter family protein [Brachyspira hyodysenteriae]MCZ9861951.1 Na/Pi cotransporter family protein [Brachyspira hyodysenteriae]MCZ9869198.1 Na/Pi cotransporter family protein [Brachyspira hyodysenteriae]